MTLTLLTGCTLGLILWDVYAVAWGAPDAQDSISRSLLRLAHEYPMALLPVGIVLGHIAWPQKKPLTEGELFDRAAANLPDEKVRLLAESRGFTVGRGD